MARIIDIFRLFFYSGWKRQILIAGALIVGAVAENVSIASLWPILSLATGRIENDTPLAHQIREIFAAIGLSAGFGSLLGLLVLGVTLKFVFSTLGMIFVGHEVARVTTRLRLQLLEAIVGAQWSRLLALPAGRLTAIMGEEGTRASMSFRASGVFVAKSAETSAYLIGCFFLSWQLSLVAIGAIVILWVSASRYVKRARRAGRSKTKSMRGLSTSLVEMLTSIKTLKAMNRHGYIGNLAARQIEKLRRAVEAEIRSETALKAVQEPAFGIVLIVCLYVGHTVFAMGISEFMASIWLLKRIADGAGAMRAAMHRIALDGENFWALVDLKKDLQGYAETLRGGPSVRLRQRCSFTGVGFSYGTVPVIEDANFAVRKGEIATLVGPSGAGKTTFIDLLIGLHRPNSGKIEIDGVDFSKIDLAAWRGRLGYIPQETILFNDTVARNVSLGDDAISEAAIERALKLAGAWGFVSSLPRSIHETIGVRGNLLSGGQKQRLAIARALVLEPDLLILDEATSALDATTAREICQSVGGLRGERTIIAVTHQSIWNEVADVIYRVRHHRVQLMPQGQKI